MDILVATVITVGLAGAANFVWRPVWRRFPWLATKSFPDLNGSWSGTLHSSWKDPATGQAPGPIPATLHIRQSLFSMSVRLKTGESTSFSTRVTLEADHEAQRFRVWYSYGSRPRAEVAHRNPRHEGTAWLEMELDESRDRLAGQYFTERRTTGDMTFERAA